MEPIRAAVLTVSDRVARGEAEDGGGPLVAGLLERDSRIRVIAREVVADDEAAIREALTRLAGAADLVVSTGGTGLAPRDVTPEATLAVLDRRLPGFEEAMRARGRDRTPLALLSRAVAGTRGAALILNLPGSPKGVEDGLAAVAAALPHAVELLRREVRDCREARERFEP